MSFARFQYPANILVDGLSDIWLITYSFILGVDAPPNFPVSIYSSHDGGSTWDYYYFPGSENYTSCQLSTFKGLYGWIFIDDQGLFSTTDGGKTWGNINKKFAGSYQNIGLHFFDEKEGISLFITTDPGEGDERVVLYRTSDGGNNWEKIRKDEWGGFLKGEPIYTTEKTLVSDSKEMVGFATASGRIIVSTDRGNSWKTLLIDTLQQEILYRVAFISPEKFAVLSGGKWEITPGGRIPNLYESTRLLSTEDGGLTWRSEVSLPVTRMGLATIPGNDSIYIAAGYFYYSKGGTFISTDSGRTFTAADSLNYNIFALGFHSVDCGFGVTFNLHDATRDDLNGIYRWNPSSLFSSGVLKR
ncbi:MAG: YCF48-related protein [Bacteroidales bacterium]|nr:YCF48-related protein [Bacteroidales bacterium]